MHVGNKSCGLMKVQQSSVATMSKGMFGEQREQNLMRRTPLQLLNRGWIHQALGLCCSQWLGEHLTDGGKNGFNYRAVNSGSNHHSVCEEAEDEKRMASPTGS